MTRKIFHREKLYSDFISECARLLVDALEHIINDPKNPLPAHALLSRIRLSSSPDVLTAAEEVLRDIHWVPLPRCCTTRLRLFCNARAATSVYVMQMRSSGVLAGKANWKRRRCPVLAKADFEFFQSSMNSNCIPGCDAFGIASRMQTRPWPW